MFMKHNKIKITTQKGLLFQLFLYEDLSMKVHDHENDTLTDNVKTMSTYWLFPELSSKSHSLH